jgi:hypothetical protein
VFSEYLTTTDVLTKNKGGFMSLQGKEGYKKSSNTVSVLTTTILSEERKKLNGGKKNERI